MSVFKWFIGVLLLVFSVALAHSEERGEQLQIRNDAEARLFNVRIERDGYKQWKLRGRVTHADRDVKVPQGKVVTVVYGKKGKQLHSLTSSYKPKFVHRKKNRASYFTVYLPKDVPSRHSTIKVYYLSD